MLRYFLFLTVGICVLLGVTSELAVQQDCGASGAVIRSVKLSIRCKRNETGKWVTTFTTRGGVDELPDGLSLDLMQTVIECDGKEMVQVKGVLGGDNPHTQPHTNTERESITFHEKAGLNIVLSNNGRTAARADPKSTFNDAIAITNRTLDDDELFEVKLDKVDTTKFVGIMKIGVTIHSPDSINILSGIEQYKSGIWAVTHNIAFFDGKTISNYEYIVREFEAGDRVGVTRKRNGQLHFFINGIDKGAAANVTGAVYGIIDLYGRAVQATIVNPR